MISRHVSGVINKNIEKRVEQRDKNIESQGGLSDNTYLLEEITS